MDISDIGAEALIHWNDPPLAKADKPALGHLEEQVITFRVVYVSSFYFKKTLNLMVYVLLLQ